jgi:O-succinylbenzoic acid--CoA ligase
MVYDSDTPDWLIEVFQTIEDWYAGKGANIHTSGSTGLPKVISLSHESMKASAHKTLQYFELKKGDSAWLCLPAKYIAGKMMVIRALVGQLNLIVTEPSADPLYSLAASVDFAAMTPMQLTLGLYSSPDKIKLIDKLILGGGPVSQDLINGIQTLPTKIYHTYGMTETVTHIAVRALNGEGISEIFTALEGVRFTTSPTSTLNIEADHLDEPLIETTDLVELINEKQFIWKGRIDNVINTGGVKVNPEEVENALIGVLKHRFFIAAEADSVLGERIILITTASDKDAESIINMASKVLERIKLPKNIYFVKEIYETPTGKIKRDLSLYQLEKA